MCPGNHESAGVQRSGKTRRGSPWLRTALVGSARSASRTKTYLGAQYRRLAARRGAKRAFVALGHTILGMVYAVLTAGQPFEDLGVAECLPRRVRRRRAAGDRLELRSDDGRREAGLRVCPGGARVARLEPRQVEPEHGEMEPEYRAVHSQARAVRAQPTRVANDEARSFELPTRMVEGRVRSARPVGDAPPGGRSVHPCRDDRAIEGASHECRVLGEEILRLPEQRVRRVEKRRGEPIGYVCRVGADPAIAR